MKNLFVVILSIIVLGGCATYWNYEGYKAKTNTEFRVLNFGDSNFSGYSETSQEEANQIALRARSENSAPHPRAQIHQVQLIGTATFTTRKLIRITFLFR